MNVYDNDVRVSLIMIQFETMMLNYIKISLLMKSTKVLVGTLENDLNFEKDKITCENGFHH